MISKILTKPDGAKEMEEVKKTLAAVKKIPNYAKYFAVTNYKRCEPGKLTEEDGAPPEETSEDVLAGIRRLEEWEPCRCK